MHEGQEPADRRRCRAFHRTVLEEFYRIALRKKIYPSILALQSDLDEWIAVYNETRPHQGR
nr:integrase core domain-containing protein [Bradyrhizobium sp. 145]